MAIALGALRNRTQLPDGSLVPWTSPLGKPMSIAATVPEYTWSDIAYALTPNGSNLDYLANASYFERRPPRRRAEAELEHHALPRGRAARLLRAGRHRSRRRHHRLEEPDRQRRPVRRQPGGRGDGRRAHGQPLGVLPRRLASPPPRRCWPTAGTTTCSRSTSRCATTTRSARSTRTRRSRCSTSTSATARGRARSPPPTAAALTAAENAWLDYYVKGVGSEPADARGGVDILTSKCPVSGAGTRFHAPSWALLAPGEIRLDGAAAQTIVAPGTAPSNAFTSGDVCTTTASADNAWAATYKVPAATSAYTLAGSPTIVAKLDVNGANDMVAARLYDVDGATERLIARGVQRPLGVGAGPTQQVFQLHPQAWTVQPGHVLKLELLAQDSHVPAHVRARRRRSSRSACRTCSCGCRSSTRPAATSATASRSRRRRRSSSRRAASSPATTRPRRAASVGGTVLGHALADAGHGGDVRRVHPGRRARVHGDDHGQRDQHRG